MKYVLFFRMCLCQSLKNVLHIQEYVKSKGVEIRFNGRGKNEASHYCGQCEVSINNFYTLVIFFKNDMNAVTNKLPYILPNTLIRRTLC